MTWTKLGDDLPERLERLGLSRSARYLHVEALVFANRLLLDGRLERRDLRRVTDADGQELVDLVAELVEAGLWTQLDDADGWQVDWTDQDAASAVRTRIELRNKRQKNYRDRVAERALRHEGGDHDLCSPKKCAARREADNNTGDVMRNATRNVSTPVQSDPVQSLPAPKGSGKGVGRRGVESTIAKAADPEFCDHGEAFGMRVLGAGAHASRKCPKCDVDHPVPVVGVQTAEERAS